MKSLIILKIFGATFGIGGGNCPHRPLWPRACLCIIIGLVLFNYFTMKLESTSLH